MRGLAKVYLPLVELAFREGTIRVGARLDFMSRLQRSGSLFDRYPGLHRLDEQSSSEPIPTWAGILCAFSAPKRDIWVGEGRALLLEVRPPRPHRRQVVLPTGQRDSDPADQNDDALRFDAEQAGLWV
jgi:hypothetical protein